MERLEKFALPISFVAYFRPLMVLFLMSKQQLTIKQHDRNHENMPVKSALQPTLDRQSPLAWERLPYAHLPESRYGIMDAFKWNFRTLRSYEMRFQTGVEQDLNHR